MPSYILVIISLIMSSFSSVNAQSIAFTFDDGPRLNQTPILTPAQRNQALLDVLAKHQIKAALFVTTGYGADKPEGLALARAWGQAGHAVGNHTVSHLNLEKSSVTLAQYQKEVLDCDAVISALPGYQKWFRFTYLREGNNPEKRDGMRAFLKAKNYMNAYVSLDTSDWRLDDKLAEVVAKNPKADLSSIKNIYLAHIWQRAQSYRDLSKKLQGRDIAQVILLHHNLINALWLSDIIEMFKDKGWTIVSPDVAFADPIYQFQPTSYVTGQSLLLSLVRSLGLPKTEDWDRLMDDGDYEMEALKKMGF